MTGRFSIYPERRIVVVTWQETVPHVEAWLETMAKILTAPGFEADFGIISDRRNVTEAPLSAFIARVIAYLGDAARNGTFVGRFAAVLPPASPFLFAMWSGLEQHAAEVGIQYCVFTRMDEAMLWITGSHEAASATGQPDQDGRPPLRPGH